MPALEILPNKSKQEKFCMFSECVKDGMVRYAKYRINLIDYPLGYPDQDNSGGYVCAECATKFKNLWDSALNG